MKYFKLDYQSIFENRQSPLGDANGELVPNGKAYFDRMGYDINEIIPDAPVFDYFYLKSFGKKEDWEWRVQDIHGFMGVGSIMTAYFISDRFKKILEQFVISKSYHFYPSKLLYKGVKLDYWVFQYAVNPIQNIILEKCIFNVVDENIEIKNIQNWEEFLEIKNKYLEDSFKKIELIKGYYNIDFDFLYNRIAGDVLVSDRLKTAIETAGLEGFIFTEVSYEVVIEV
jgi:hypothetical protein